MINCKDYQKNPQAFRLEDLKYANYIKSNVGVDNRKVSGKLRAQALFYSEDPKAGLSKEEAKLRKIHHYNNENNVKTTKSGFQIIRENLFSFFNITKKLYPKTNLFY